MPASGYTGLSPDTLYALAGAQEFIEEHGEPRFPVCPCCGEPLDAAHEKTSCGRET
jgi:hypothetical protein